jgi:hypothetical protein
MRNWLHIGLFNPWLSSSCMSLAKSFRCYFNRSLRYKADVGIQRQRFAIQIQLDPPPVATFSSAVKAITVLSGLFPLASAATTRIETLVPGSQERFMDCRADPTFVALLNSPALMLPMAKLRLLLLTLHPIGIIWMLVVPLMCSCEIAMVP